MTGRAFHSRLCECWAPQGPSPNEHLPSPKHDAYHLILRACSSHLTAVQTEAWRVPASAQLLKGGTSGPKLPNPRVWLSPSQSQGLPSVEEAALFLVWPSRPSAFLTLELSKLVLAGGPLLFPRTSFLQLYRSQPLWSPTYIPTQVVSTSSQSLNISPCVFPS